MQKTITIPRLLAAKTDKLQDIGTDGTNTQRLAYFKLNAVAGKEYEKHSKELLDLSGKVKRMCKDLHVLAEKCLNTPDNTKKQKYIDKINAMREKLNPILSQWHKEIQKGKNVISSYFPMLKEFSLKDFGVTESDASDEEGDD